MSHVVLLESIQCPKHQSSRTTNSKMTRVDGTHIMVMVLLMCVDGKVGGTMCRYMALKLTKVWNMETAGP
jgi:hypothetical protein